MAVDLMGCTNMDDQIAIQEAASGLRSMEHLIHRLSDQHHHHQQVDCRDIADLTVSKFKKVISILNRTGHARFRRGPMGPSPQAEPESLAAAAKTLTLAPTPLRVKPPNHPLAPPPPPPPSQTLTLDFTKPTATVVGASEVSPPSRYTKDYFSISTPISSATSSFMSSVTGDGSVSDGRLGAVSLLLLPPPASAVKPPLSSPPLDRRCHEHSHAHSEHIAGKYAVPGARCHCSKRRKSRVKRTIRVPAISSKVADIPADEYSWRKYGQKPIKGSPYPRGYYKCSTVRGCPARKHVERAPDDSSMLIVSYEGEHRHTPGDCVAVEPPTRATAAVATAT
ncbi:hypothetical protein Cni_G02769 [Canna indica]|uniref:WRKY domain-containing protein n=1 Tax=Canna indica TaxID=4628 RepID=A0AAQ3JRV7_9LILI|nr:hypothetical protein Cni_G02769 [Canna indica]